jgi:N-acetylmuramoyl-L-alanine amidase
MLIMRNSAKLFMILIAFASFAFISPENSEAKQINVVIDAGHGGEDFGVSQDGITEKQIVEQVITKIQTFNKNKNIIIHFTRSTDKFIPLQDRTDFINTIKPDLVLSLHVNASPNSNKSGMEFYVSKETSSYEISNEIAAKFHDAFLNANFKVSAIKNANYHILKKSEVPAIIIELGYLTNETDRKYLTDDEEQNKIATSISNLISTLK